MVRGFYSTEEVFRGVSARPLMGAGAARKFVLFFIYIDRLSADIFCLVSVFRTPLFLLIAMLVPKLDNAANIL